MASNTWQTFRKTDAELIASFRKIAATQDWGGAVSLHVQLAQGHGPAINGPFETVIANSALKDLVGLGGALAWRMTLTLHQQSIQIERPIDRNIDIVGLNFPDQLQPEKLVRLLSVTHAELPTYARVESIDRLLGDELAEFYRAREAGLLKLEGLTQNLAHDTAAYRQTLDERLDAKTKELEQGIVTRRDQIESELAVQRETLGKKEEALNEREKKLDDRASRHARRQLRLDLQKVLADRGEKFQLTKGTGGKRIAVHVLYSALLVILVATLTYEIGFLGFRYNDWVANVRVAITFTAIVATFVLYIRWTDQWFRQHADEEFRLKRMSLDVDRASWVVETALEWQQQNQSPIPAQLLEQLSRELFAPASASTPVRHPAEDMMAAILSASSGLKINIPGIGEASLNRRGVQRLQNEISGEKS
jgi:hypothetical protein